MTEDTAASARRTELADNLARTQEQIAEACRRNHRRPEEVSVIAVTKMFPAADVRHLASLGVTDFGENREQESTSKAHEVSESGVDVRWHFIGRLQRNKCRAVASYVDMVHSVDRMSLVSALDNAAIAQREHALPVLLQLSLDSDVKRGGVPAEHDEELAVEVLARKGLRLRGVMAVAPRDWQAERAFETLADRAGRLRRIAPDANVICAGMSGDFVTAIEYGATVIRLGANLLGPRADVGYPVG